MAKGVPAGPSCVQDYDKAGWVMGTSSSLFHYFNVTNDPTWTSPNSSLNIGWNLVKNTFNAVQPNQEIDCTKPVL